MKQITLVKRNSFSYEMQSAKDVINAKSLMSTQDNWTVAQINYWTQKRCADILIFKDNIVLNNKFLEKLSFQ